MLQPQRVPDLVDGDLGEVDPPGAPEGPELVVVEVNVARGPALLGKEGVRQSPPRFIKGVSVPVFSSLEPDNSKP